MSKEIKNLSDQKNYGTEILDNSTITSGTFNALSIKDDIIFCDTNSGDIIINGFDQVIKGRKITIIKTSPLNSIKINHLSSLSNYKINNSPQCNIELFKETTGTFELTCDGNFWYCFEKANSFSKDLSISASAQTIIKLNNVKGVIFDFCVECPTGTSIVQIKADKLNLISTTGKFTQTDNIIAGTMNAKITYSVTFTNTSILLNVTTTQVIASVNGYYQILK